MFLPDWVYRSLPFMYVMAGLIVASKMDHAFGVGAGVLLVATGLYVWKMRYEYRHEIDALKRRSKRVW
jgi:hypothetical protein